MNKDSTARIAAVSGGATALEGFVSAGVYCGIRHQGVLDLGLLFSERACTAAGVFTRNAVRGAPLGVTGEALDRGPGVRAVVVNSGVANAATGRRGVEAAYETQAAAAGLLGLANEEVAVASTGVIGEHLPMDRVTLGLEEAAAGLSRDGAGFAEAILTTDTRTKEAAVQVALGGETVTVGGTAKGSGMIEPDMGTMLAFLTTDAAVEEACLRETLREAVEETFNRVIVDGDTSPSDMALFLANGAAGNEPLTEGSAGYPLFREAVGDVCRTLAKEIARDGEGATKLIEARVEGARDEASAAALARSVVGSSLVKTAVAGEDANWGRVLVAMGYSGGTFDPEDLDLYFGPVKVFSAGEPAPHDQAEANGALAGDEVIITARLREGESGAVAWGCDLTYEYVRINGSYRT